MADHSKNEFDRSELSRMIDALICQTITELEFEKLTQQLENPAARDFYLAEIEIESGLLGLKSDETKRPGNFFRPD